MKKHLSFLGKLSLIALLLGMTMQNVFAQCDDITTLPYTENFESYEASSFPTCWTRVSNPPAYVADMTYVVDKPDGEGKALHILAFGGTSICVSMEKMADNIQMDSLEITFKMRAQMTGQQVVMGIMTDPTDISTFEPFATVGASADNTWETVKVLTTGITSTGRYIAFKLSREMSGAQMMYFDDVKVQYKAVCTDPSNLIVYNVGQTSATLNWTTHGESEWMVSYKKETDTDWTPIHVTTPPPYVLNGLDSAEYEVRVRAICGAGDSTAYTATKYFVTARPANQVSSIGHGIENKDQVLPIYVSSKYSYSQQLFTQEELHTTLVINAISFNYTATTPLTGKDSILIYLGHTTKDRFTGTDDFVHIDDMELVYRGTLNCSTGWITLRLSRDFFYNGEDNLVLAAYDYSGIGGGQGKTFATNNLGVHRALHYFSDYQKIDIDNPDNTPNSTEGTKVPSFIRNNVRFYYYADATYGDCEDATNVLATPYSTSAKISWDNVDWTRWSVEYKETTESTYTTDIANTSVHTITGLTPETNYDVRIKTLCENGMESEYVITSFTTLEATADTCARATNIQIEPSLDGAVITWDNVDNTEWIVEYKRASNETFIVEPQVSVATYTLTELLSDTEYDIRIRTICENGNESEYAEATFTTLAPFVCPTASNIQSNVTTTTAVITWDNIEGAEWSFEYRISSDDTYSTPVTVTEPTYSLEELTPETSYDIRIKTLCEEGEESVYVVTNFITNPLGIKTINMGTVSIYPVPVSSTFKVTMDTDYSQLSIANMAGQVLLINEIASKEITVDISSFSAGIYFVTLTGKSGMATKKVVKR